MRKLLALMILFALLCACQQTQVTKRKERFFWPPPPNEPKIEFIGLYQSSRDLPKPKSFLRMLTGETDPEVRFRKPLNVAADDEGSVVVSDMIPQGGTVWNFNTNTVEVITEEPSIQMASGVCFDSSRLYVADAKAGNIKVFSRKERRPLYIMGDGELESPAGIAINEAANRLYVADTRAHKVFVFDIESRKFLFMFGKGGEQEGEFNRPWGIALDKKGDVYVGDGLNARVQIFDKDGKFLAMFGKRGDKAGGFAQVKGVALDSDGNIYVVDPLKAIQIFNRKGDLLGLLGAPGNKGIGAMNLPMGIAIDKRDRIYVVDQLNRILHVFQYMNAEYKQKNPASFDK